MMDWILFFIAICGAGMAGIYIDKLITTKKNIARNIFLAIMGILLCLENMILTEIF